MRLIIHIYTLAVGEVLITLRDREVTFKVHENTQHSSLVTSARFEADLSARLGVLSS